jgi:hypothetical protein
MLALVLLLFVEGILTLSLYARKEKEPFDDFVRNLLAKKEAGKLVFIKGGLAA